MQPLCRCILSPAWQTVACSRMAKQAVRQRKETGRVPCFAVQNGFECVAKLVLKNNEESFLRRGDAQSVQIKRALIQAKKIIT